MQHRAKTQVRGRHRRTAPLHSHRAASPRSHRAPSGPFAERGRYALVTAALVGVGVAGVSGATAALGHPGAGDPYSATQALIVHAAEPQPAAGASSAGGVAPARSVPAGTATGTPSASAGSAPADAQAAATPSVTPASAATPRAYARGRHKPRPVPPAPKRVVQKLLPGQQATAGNKARQAYKARHAARPKWVNPMPEGRVTSCFGQRWGRLHAGVDLAAPHGTRIRAAGAGTVVSAGPEGGYGNAVLIDHGNGYLTHYGHMSVVTVRAGQRVVASEQIGNEGSTGFSTGPHLHFEVHQGAYRNPVEPTGWMQAHGAVIPGCVAVRVQ